MLNRYKIKIINETMNGQFPDGFLLISTKIPFEQKLEHQKNKTKWNHKSTNRL